MAVIPSKNLVCLTPGVFTGDEDADYNNVIKPYFTALQRVIEAMK